MDDEELISNTVLAFQDMKHPNTFLNALPHIRDILSNNPDLEEQFGDEIARLEKLALERRHDTELEIIEHNKFLYYVFHYGSVQNEEMIKVPKEVLGDIHEQE